MKEQKCAYCDAKAINQCAECKKPICPIHTVIDVDRHFARVCFRCAMQKRTEVKGYVASENKGQRRS
jgi:hypothetical protein